MAEKENRQEIIDQLRSEKLESLAENKVIRLSVKGTEAYQGIQYGAIKQFTFWLFVGNCGGFVLSKFVDFAPLGTTSPTKLKKYRYLTFFACLVGVSYHGYKVSKFNFIKQKKALLASPENVLEEPSDLY
jgi:hypothetical protein